MTTLLWFLFQIQRGCVFIPKVSTFLQVSCTNARKKAQEKKARGLSKNRAKVTWYGAQIQLHQQSLSMTQLNFWSTVMQSRQNQ